MLHYFTITNGRLGRIIALSAGILLLAAGLVAYRMYAIRTDFYGLLAIWTPLVLGMLLVLSSGMRSGYSIAWGVGLRCLLLGALPLLSDDTYRFLWDGHLWNHGIHPFAYTPRTVLDTLHVPGITREWFLLLNSPDYHTVYPPLGQFLFRIAAFWANGNVETGVLYLQFFILTGEIATLWVLRQYLRQTNPEWTDRGVLLYAFNPLVIVETVGNGHFEGMMAGCMLATLLLLHQRRAAWSGVFWAAGVAVKLLPLLFLPLVIGWLGKQRAGRFLAGFIPASLAFFLPLADLEVLRNMQSSVHLYFQKFEFNASFYYLFSHVSPWFTGWYEGATIGPVLAQITVFVVLYLAFWLLRKTDRPVSDVQTALLISSTLYLLNATTVHPWYVIIPLVCSIGIASDFAVAWSVVVFFSYSHYIGGGRQEQFGWIALEYAVVIGLIIRTLYLSKGKVANDFWLK